MPIGRYFLFIGSALLALLLIANWYFPPLATDQKTSSVDRTTIRLQSAAKWPNAVVFDTTQPTIAPPPAETATAVAPAKAARDAYAMANEPTATTAKAAEPVKAAKAHVRRTRAARGNELPGSRGDWFAPRREAFAVRSEGLPPRGFWPSW